MTDKDDTLAHWHPFQSKSIAICIIKTGKEIYYTNADKE